MEHEILLNEEVLQGKSPTADHVVKMTYGYWLSVLNTITRLSNRVAVLEAKLAQKLEPKKETPQINDKK